MYLTLKFLHILTAIVGVGFSTTFGFIMMGGAAEPPMMPFALRVVRRLERVSSSAFLGLIATGLGMVWFGGLDWRASWIAVSLFVTAVALALSNGLAKPNLRRMVELSEQSAPPAADMQRLGARGRKVGMALSLCSLTLIGLMIFKPS